MRRLVFDTNIYIDWINQGEHEDVLFQPEAVKYLSSVVLMELRAGAFRARDVRLIERLETTFAKADRLLVPSRRAWSIAGTVLRGLHVERGYNLDGRGAIVNDVLLAVSAREMGAFVVTQNERDFRAIAAVYPFGLIVVPGVRTSG